MKQIVRLAKNKYIHLDSYAKATNPCGTFIIALMFTAVMAVTVSAIFGTDATQPFQPTHSTQLKP